MKLKIIYLLLFILGINSSSAQTKEEILKKIAVESCECMNKQEISNLINYQQKVLVPCIVSSVENNSKTITNIYKVPADDVFMISNFKDILPIIKKNCPKIFSDLKRKLELEEEIKKNSLEGKIVKITNEEFSIKDNSGVTQDLLILKKFSGSDLIIQNKLKKGDTVLYNYIETELYDFKIKDFKKYKVVTFLEKK